MSSTMAPPFTPLRAPVVASYAVPLIVVSTVFTSLAISAVFLRFLAKRSNRGVGLDDWIILAALLFSFGLYTSGILICTVGFAGFHTDVLLIPQIERFLKIVYIDNIFYAFTLSTTKFSILIMYHRIFRLNALFHYSLYAVGLIVLGWLIGVVLAQILTCIPIEGAWNLTVQATANCIDTTAFYYGNAIANLLTDVIILCLPMPMIWHLNMNKHKKLALSGVFLLGSFVCISSIVRIVSLSKIVNADITYTLVDVGVWTSTEAPLAIVCACLPTLPAYFKSWKRQLDGSQGSSHGSTSKISFLRFRRSKNSTRGHTAKSDHGSLEAQGGLPLNPIARAGHSRLASESSEPTYISPESRGESR